MTEPVSTDTQAKTTHAVNADALAWLRDECLDVYAAAERLDTARERLLDLPDPRLPPPNAERLREVATEVAREMDLISDGLMGTVNTLEGWADRIEEGDATAGA